MNGTDTKIYNKMVNHILSKYPHACDIDESLIRYHGECEVGFYPTHDADINYSCVRHKDGTIEILTDF